MKIKSTKVLNNLTFDSIFELEGKVSSVVVISAYTDVDWIQKMVSHILKNGNQVDTPHFSIYLDFHASGYSSNSDTRDILNMISDTISKNFTSESGIFLVTSGHLFHSKCIVSESRSSINIILGSLNFTESGFLRNEELVFSGQAMQGGNSHVNQLVNQIWSYIGKLSYKNIGLDDVMISPLSLRQVLLNGEMYYEQKENDPFNFPLNIHDNIRDIDQLINPLLGAKINNSISLEHIITETEELKQEIETKKNSKSSWKKYCIETCYGFWAPTEERPNITEVIDEKYRIRSPYFISLFNIVKNQKKKIRKQFENIAFDIEQYVIEQNKFDENGNLISWSSKENLLLWDEWYKRLEEKLKTEGIRKRIIVGVTSASVPNVWSDKRSALDLENSFAENLQYYYIKGQISITKHSARTFSQKYSLNENEYSKCLTPEEMVMMLNKAIGTSV